MPADLSATGRAQKREAYITELETKVVELENQICQAQDELLRSHDALYAIVEAKGRGGLKIAKDALSC